MSIESLSVLMALILAISLVTERVMTFIKTAIPGIANDLEAAGKERARRVFMQVLAFATACGTAGFMVEGDWTLRGTIQLAEGAGTIPVLMLGLLATGGSALWKDLLGITNTIKRVKKGEPIN